MNIATDTHGIVYLIDVPPSVGAVVNVRCRYAMQTRNVQTQTLVLGVVDHVAIMCGCSSFRVSTPEP